MYTRAVLLSVLAALAEARFGQEQVPIAAIGAVTSGGAPGQAATLAGAAISTLLGAANPCDKLSKADEIIATLGTGADAVAAAKGLVAAEQNFNPSATDKPNVCADASLPATEILRGIVPLVDPAVTGSGVENANSAASINKPFNANGLSVAQIMAANGFTNFNTPGGAAAAGGNAGANNGNANKGNANTGNANNGNAKNNGNANNAGAANGDNAQATAAPVASAAPAADACPSTLVTVTRAAAVATGNADANNGNANNGNANNGNANNGNANNNDNANNGNANDGNANNGNANNGNANNGNANNGNANNGNANNGNANNGNANNNDNANNGGATGGGAATGGADFGACTPTILRAGGLGGRPATEFTFQATDPLVSKGQQEALNPNIITNRVCDQLTNVCNANAAAKALCLDAKAKVLASGARDASVVTLFNGALGF